MIIRTNEDWEKVFDMLKDKSQVPMLIDGFRVLLSTGAVWSKMKLTIMPIVEGVYFPDHLKPLHDTQTYDDNIESVVPFFYYKKIEYIYSAKNRAYLKKRCSKKAYKNSPYESYRYYYDSFNSFKALKTQYSKNFYRIELLEHISDALFDRKVQLPGGIGNALPPAPKALNPGDEKQEGNNES